MRMHELYTERLVMAVLGPDDLSFMLKLTGNPDVIRYVPGMITDAPTMEAWLRSLKPEDHEYQILLRETGTPIGECSLTLNPDGRTCEVGYMLLPEYWEQGYGTEAVAWLIELATSLGMEKVTAMTHHDNAASSNLLKKLGFQREAIGWFLYENGDGLSDDCVDTYVYMANGNIE